jgi:preprotein translocase subunit SecF
MLKNLVRFRYRWFLLSALLIVPNLLLLLFYPLATTGQFRLGLEVGIDFSGGALWEIRFLEADAENVGTNDIAEVFAGAGFEGAQVQRSDMGEETEGFSALIRTRPLSPEDPTGEQERVLEALEAEYGQVRRERLESVGPTISQESTRSAVLAVAGASVAILLYMTWAFRNAPNPVRYGVCALISMVHDILLIMGVAALLGILMGLEVDALFLTAMLTILSFSVHDTIVVFDRIRENLSFRQDETFDDIVNHSIVQTLPRSINTQLTTMFTLTALLLFGGDTIHDFVLILLIGLISGTYSSIFNAAQLLVVWEHREWENWFGRGGHADQPSAVSG